MKLVPLRERTEPEAAAIHLRNQMHVPSTSSWIIPLGVYVSLISIYLTRHRQRVQCFGVILICDYLVICSHFLHGYFRLCRVYEFCINSFINHD